MSYTRVTVSRSVYRVTIGATTGVRVTQPAVSSYRVRINSPSNQGAVGPAGSQGDPGPAGVGVPAGGTTGQLLAKASNIDHDTEFVDPAAGGGDVNSVFGRTGVVVAQVGDYSTTQVTEGTNLYYTTARVAAHADVAANTAARHSHANSAILDAITASFTLAQETKLAGIAVGAQVNTVDSVNTQTGAVVLGTDEVAEGLTNLYYTEARVGANTAVAANTTHRGLVTNPHSVTLAQVGAAAAVHSHTEADITDLGDYLTDAPSDGTTYGRRNGAWIDAGGALSSTDDLPEGLINLYYTEARVSANADVAANTTARHSHANLLELALITDGAHEGRLTNPHGVTAAQVGASPTGHGHVVADISDFTTAVTAHAAVAANTTHRGLTNNPHSVTLAQVGGAAAVHDHIFADITDGLTTDLALKSVQLQDSVVANLAGGIPGDSDEPIGLVVMDVSPAERRAFGWRDGTWPGFHTDESVYIGLNAGFTSLLQIGAPGAVTGTLGIGAAQIAMTAVGLAIGTGAGGDMGLDISGHLFVTDRIRLNSAGLEPDSQIQMGTSPGGGDPIPAIGFDNVLKEFLMNYPLNAGTLKSDDPGVNPIKVEDIIEVDIINELTPNGGVTIDGVLIKDGLVDSAQVGFNGSGHTAEDMFKYNTPAWVISGGVVTDMGGLNVQWTAGTVYSRFAQTIDAFNAQATPLALTDDAVNYLIYEEGSSTLVARTSHPDHDLNEICLAHVHCANGDIWSILQRTAPGETMSDMLHGMGQIFDTLVTSGMLVAEDPDATNAFDVIQSAGTFFKAVSVETASPEIVSRATPLRRWYKDGVGTDYTNDTNAEIDVTQYDNAGVLTAIPSNKWVRSVFFSAGTYIHWVYPVAYYNSAAEAINAGDPPLPAGLTGLPRTGSVVYQQGATALPPSGSDQWIDSRPLAGTSPGGATGVTSHLNLTDIGINTHAEIDGKLNDRFEGANVYRVDGEGAYAEYVATADTAAARGVALTTAIAAASAGELVYVRSGTYDAHKLMKDGVNLYCEPGVVVQYTGGVSGAIFEDGGAAMSMVVDGYGEFRQSGTVTNRQAVNLSNGASTLHLRCKRLVSDNSVAIVLTGTGSGGVVCYADTVLSSDGTLDNVSTGMTIEVFAREVISENGLVVELDGGTIIVHGAVVRSDDANPVEVIDGDGVWLDRCRIQSAGGEVCAIVYGGHDPDFARFTDCEFNSGGNATDISGDAETIGCYRVNGDPVVTGSGSVSLGHEGRTDNPHTVVQRIGISLDGGGDDIPTGFAGDIYIPKGVTIVSAVLLAEPTTPAGTGSISIDIMADLYANFPPVGGDTIVDAFPPTISAGIKDKDTTLQDWTTVIPADSTLRFNVDSCSGLTRCTLTLEVI